jgi:S-adenosylmethionine/arginine decarboxylase-like enzyme
MNVYGYSTILDLVEADSTKFTRENIERFLAELCDRIDMVREDLYFWDYEDDPVGYAIAPAHLRGISAVQFIKTSSIVIHTLDDKKAVFIDLFSCKLYDPRILSDLAVLRFGGRVCFSQTFVRAAQC